jgi:hypothetical protein
MFQILKKNIDQRVFIKKVTKFDIKSVKRNLSEPLFGLQEIKKNIVEVPSPWRSNFSRKYV